MCTTCGRPWVVCKGDCGCKKSCCNNVNFCEYGRAVPGCIRERAPECPMQAVIPSVVVESVSNLKNLADCFVHVTNINTTFYIDDKHRTMVTWAGPVEYNNYDLDTNSLGLRSQFLLDFANNRAAYYNATGEYEVFGLDESSNSGDTYTISIADGVSGSVGLPFENIYSTEGCYYKSVSYDNSGIVHEFDVTNSAGTTLSTDELFALKDTFLNSKFKFTTTVQYGSGTPKTILIEATPSNITVQEEYGDSGIIVSGMFSVDERELTETIGVMQHAPLRWSLMLEISGGEPYWARFTVEKIDSTLGE